MLFIVFWIFKEKLKAIWKSEQKCMQLVVWTGMLKMIKNKLFFIFVRSFSACLNKSI